MQNSYSDFQIGLIGLGKIITKIYLCSCAHVCKVRRETILTETEEL